MKMHFFTLALLACTTFAVAMADVSHLVKHYIPPNPMLQLSPVGKMAMNPNKSLSVAQTNGELIVTTIEKQELQELPTQIEYLQPGQMPYGFDALKDKQNNKFADRHDGGKTLKMLMPSPTPSLSLMPMQTPSMQEQAPTLMPNKRYLAPSMNGGVSKIVAQQNNMRNEQMSSPTLQSNQYLARSMNDYSKMRAQQQQQQPQQPQQPQQHTMPSKQYLTPMSINMQNKMPEKISMNEPSKQYLAPTTMSSHEQELQDQSAPAPQYLPPQKQATEMSKNKYVPTQLHKYEIQQQQQQTFQTPPPTPNYLPPQANMKKQPMFNTILQMQPSQENLSPFGEAENVAEAAQEAIEMFDEKFVHQPMPSPLVEEGSANYYMGYLHPQLSKFPHFSQYQQPEQLTSIDFVYPHNQQMMRAESVNDAAKIQISSIPMPTYFLTNDGYHYNNVGNHNELSSRHNSLRQVRQ